MKHIKIFLILLLIPLSFFAQKTVSGNVTETSTGASLPGVDVIIKGTTKGTATDFNGNYSLDNVKTGDVSVKPYPSRTIISAALNIRFNLDDNGADPLTMASTFPPNAACHLLNISLRAHLS